MEIPLIEEMRQLRRLEELDLLSPHCHWDGFQYGKEYDLDRAFKARKIWHEIMAQCQAFEVYYGL